MVYMEAGIQASALIQEPRRTAETESAMAARRAVPVAETAAAALLILLQLLQPFSPLDLIAEMMIAILTRIAIPVLLIAVPVRLLYLHLHPRV